MSELGKDYVTVCISTYPNDLAELDAKVEAIKAAGYQKANRSWLIRQAIRNLDVDAAIEQFRRTR